MPVDPAAKAERHVLHGDDLLICEPGPFEAPVLLRQVEGCGPRSGISAAAGRGVLHRC